MQNKARPLSPHLQIYRWQLTMFLSILHRATGFGLALGAPLAVWWLMAALNSAKNFDRFHEFAHSLIGQLMLAGWLFSLSFHFLNGLRHLVWDTGRWLTLKGAYASGYVVLFGSVLLTAALWFYAGK
ncbi:MAG: succinate dehydrogenase, cytochrome b556 subunit [Bdellovibrionales bacterium]|jgi:succinate dehydrogenase / fumarate reductase cytochrome b subunit|nr:succinate dehydrogenase, cytochrome b556 subunit [Bdellovibrionales bacterium]